MATWKDLDLSSLEEKDEEPNLCLMVKITSKDEDDKEKKDENLKEEKTNDLCKVNTFEVNEQLKKKKSLTLDKV
ncbi:hypothetical protein CR513_27898, partial [Mucuna pruriens]